MSNTLKETAIISTPIKRYCSLDIQLQETTDEIIEEQAISILVDSIGTFTIFCTPIEVRELAIGFLFTEGLIETIDDVDHISQYDAQTQSISIKLASIEAKKNSRYFLITSSCGLCGKRNIENLFKTIPPCSEKMLVYLDKIDTVFEQMRQQQILFKKTGATHAAALFNKHGKIISCCEDIGRHNALDKIIGKRILEKHNFKGLGLALSGRISFDLVAKAARAQIELIIAISAPTSLAIKAAKHWNITLCGFVRPGRANIYYDPLS